MSSPQTALTQGVSTVLQPLDSPQVFLAVLKSGEEGRPKAEYNSLVPTHSFILPHTHKVHTLVINPLDKDYVGTCRLFDMGCGSS